MGALLVKEKKKQAQGKLDTAQAFLQRTDVKTWCKPASKKYPRGVLLVKSKPEELQKHFKFVFILTLNNTQETNMWNPPGLRYRYCGLRGRGVGLLNDYILLLQS